MFKNKFLKLASILLMLCLITTCGVSGTFAKYTTGGTATDSARVAKWGVTVNVASDQAFKTEYKNSSNETIVQSSTAGKVIAPGTSGALAIITLGGTPEVAVNVTYDVSLTLEGWKIDANTEYCPIVFTIGGETYGLTGIKTSSKDTPTPTHTYGTIAQLISAVEGAIEGINNSYAAGTNLSGKGNISASWEWAFSGNDDAKDTALGTALTPPTVEFSLTVSVTQID
jgi:hypothetical protein